MIEHIRQAIKNSSETQSKIASRAKIRREVICRFLNGGNITTDTLEKIIAASGVEISVNSESNAKYAGILAYLAMMEKTTNSLRDMLVAMNSTAGEVSNRSNEHYLEEMKALVR